MNDKLKNAVLNVPELRFPEFSGDWEVFKLKNIAKFYSGGTPLSTRKDYYNGDIPFIKSGEISKNKTKQYISQKGYDSSSAKMVLSGDLLYALYGATSGEVSISKINGAVNQAVLCIRGDFDNDLLCNYLRYNKERIIATYLQGGQGNLSADIVKNICVSLPNSSEQQKIAGFLKQVDKRIEKLEEKKDKLEQYKKGIMQKLFSQQIRFKDEDGNDYPAWEEKKFGDFTKINQGLQIPISERLLKQRTGSYFYITNEFLKEGSLNKYFVLNPSLSVLCTDDDILMTRTGNTGQVVTGVTGVFHNNFFKIKFDRNIANKDFLVYFLRLYKTQCKILRLAGTSTIPDLNHGDFYRLGISLPYLLEQEKIADFLSAIDKQIEKTVSQIDSSKAFKKGLLQKMFI